MEKWTLCNSKLKGNVVDWTTAEWEITSMAQIDISKEQICNSLALGPILFPEKQDALGFKNFCNKMNATLFLTKDEADLRKVKDLTMSFIPKCNSKGTTSFQFLTVKIC